MDGGAPTPAAIVTSEASISLKACKFGTVTSVLLETSAAFITSSGDSEGAVTSVED